MRPKITPFKHIQILNVYNTDCYCPIIGNCTTTTYTANLTKLRSKNMHEGTHNKRYFFTIKVINTAYLVAIEHIDILLTRLYIFQIIHAFSTNGNSVKFDSTLVVNEATPVNCDITL
jgi:hypothetical protein